jgi:MFS family permease
MRGRVMALYMAVFTGGTPLGAPMVGWVANVAVPRWAIGVAAASGFVAAGVAIVWLVRGQHLRVRRVRGGEPEPVTGALPVLGAGRFHYRLQHDGDAAAVRARDETAAELAVDEGTATRPS